MTLSITWPTIRQTNRDPKRQQARSPWKHLEIHVLARCKFQPLFLYLSTQYIPFTPYWKDMSILTSSSYPRISLLPHDGTMSTWPGHWGPRARILLANNMPSYLDIGKAWLGHPDTIYLIILSCIFDTICELDCNLNLPMQKHYHLVDRRKQIACFPRDE